MSARIEKTVFISYRRVDSWPALAVFKDLTQNGFDVFIDYDGIASGDFERAIVDNIRSRAHFVVLLTPTALERCDEPGDWLRRELETAIDCGRNIVPLMLDGFTFSHQSAVQRLQGSLAPLRRYQALNVPMDFFDEAMVKLRTRRLAAAIDTVLHPRSEHAAQVARQQKEAASVAVSVESPGMEAGAAPAPAMSPSPARPSPAPQPRPAPARAPSTTAGSSNYMMPVGVTIALIALFLVGVAVKELKQEPASPQAALTTPAEPAASEVVPPESQITPAAGGPTDASAQNTLGDDFYFGRKGHPQDDAAAVAWYRRAADQGLAEGQANLGYMYEMGRGGLARDDVSAAKWYRKAADQGLGSAQANLGVMYQFGRGGLPSDDAKAVEWYRKAADGGDATALADLGFMFEKGRGGLSQDETQAVSMYRKSADKGNALGQANLGAMYEAGRGGLAKDDVKAVELYRMAAAQNGAPGQADLADMYERGAGGLERNQPEALRLYRLAAAQGNEYAKAALTRLSAN